MTYRQVTPIGAEPLRHGYTLDDLHRLAKLAAHSARGWMAADYLDIVEAAWFGAVEALYLAEDPPRPHELVRAGQRAVNHLAKDEMHHAGYYRYADGPGHGPGSMPAYAAYWWNQAAPTPSPETGIVERRSVAQILPTLTPSQRAALLALAVHDNHLAAANASEMTYGTFRSHIQRGRRRFLALWHEGEEPSKPWGCDRRVATYQEDADA